MEFGAALGAKWNGTEYELRFPNGSLIMFRYAETIKDATRRQGGQYQLLIFDERTLTPPDVISFLESRLRSGRPDIPVLGIRSSANPGGSGHGAVKLRYIAPTNYGERVYIDERGRTVRFIPCRLGDNPHVNAEYAADLRALPEKLRAAFLDGDWDVFAGQMFPELSPRPARRRAVRAPGVVAAGTTASTGAIARPGASLWAAVDEDGRVWFYREMYARRRRRGRAGKAHPRRRGPRRACSGPLRGRRDVGRPGATRSRSSAVYAENGVSPDPGREGRAGRGLAARPASLPRRGPRLPASPGARLGYLPDGALVPAAART